MSKPPPAPPRELRLHPRVELFAQVQVSKQSEVYIMSTANISRGGVFISGDPGEYPELVEGATVDLVIFAGEDLSIEDARLRGRVVRVVPPGRGPLPGFGVEFLPLQAAEARGLDRLLQAARAR
jgi:hypothetical protein